MSLDNFSCEPMNFIQHNIKEWLNLLKTVEIEPGRLLSIDRVQLISDLDGVVIAKTDDRLTAAAIFENRHSLSDELIVLYGDRRYASSLDDAELRNLGINP